MILLLGILSSIVSKRLKIPNILLLILVGIVLNNVTIHGEKMLQFPPVFLTSVATFALVMIVFDGTSKFKLRDVDIFSVKVLKLVVLFIVLTSIFLTTSTLLFFKLNSTSIIFNVSLALIFSLINCGTDPGTVLIMLQGGREKISKLLKIESVLNTPFMVLLPFIIIDLMETVEVGTILPRIAEQFMPFIQQFVTGIGSGVLIGIIFFKFMRKKFSQKLSPLAIITAALVTYTLAENLNGNGVLAVTTLGLFFGNVLVADKEHLFEFSTLLATALEILVFVFIGFMIEIPITWGFFFKSIMLFILYLVIRFAAIYITFREEFNLKEKLFMTLNVSKGIAVATIAFALTTLYAEPGSVLYQLEGVPSLLNLTLVFMFYSIILSTIMIRFTDFFLKREDNGNIPDKKKLIKKKK